MKARPVEFGRTIGYSGTCNRCPDRIGPDDGAGWAPRIRRVGFFVLLDHSLSG